MATGPTDGKPARRTVQISIDKHHLLAQAAAKRDVPMGGLIGDLIEREFAAEFAERTPKRKKRASLSA